MTLERMVHMCAAGAVAFALGWTLRDRLPKRNTSLMDDPAAQQVFSLQPKHTNRAMLLELLNHYPMTLSCGGPQSCIVISRKTPGYDIKNRPYKVLAQGEPGTLPEFPSVVEMTAFLEQVTYAEIACGQTPHLEHVHCFSRTITGPRWTAIVDELEGAQKITVRHCTAADMADTRLITHVNNTPVEPHKAVDELAGLDNEFEQGLFALLVRDETTSGFSTQVQTASQAPAENLVVINDDSDSSLPMTDCFDD